MANFVHNMFIQVYWTSILDFPYSCEYCRAWKQIKCDWKMKQNRLIDNMCEKNNSAYSLHRETFQITWIYWQKANIKEFDSSFGQ